MSQHLYTGQHMIAARITVRLYGGGHFIDLRSIKAQAPGCHLGMPVLMWMRSSHGIVMVGCRRVVISTVDDEKRPMDVISVDGHERDGWGRVDCVSD
ncbi:hypothetical protein CFBP6109_P300052 (plasmid) [Pseudomonas syringae pv. cerasicola]|nr:hypothetical protein CFBP6109_P300052 [Pseudomonas syringae pv. cerasicola]